MTGQQLGFPGVAPERSAVLSPCGRYRYLLERCWDPAGTTVTWVMLNPSTADADVDDPTIRRVVGFSKAWGHGRARVVNVYGLRATDPAELVRARKAGLDPVGQFNDQHIQEAIEDATVVVAWGGHTIRRRRPDLERLLAYRALHCLGVTKDGSPKHPLYVPAATRRRLWTFDHGLIPEIGPNGLVAPDG